MTQTQATSEQNAKVTAMRYQGSKWWQGYLNDKPAGQLQKTKKAAIQTAQAVADNGWH